MAEGGRGWLELGAGAAGCRGGGAQGRGSVLLPPFVLGTTPSTRGLMAQALHPELSRLHLARGQRSPWGPPTHAKLRHLPAEKSWDTTEQPRRGCPSRDNKSRSLWLRPQGRPGCSHASIRPGLGPWACWGGSALPEGCRSQTLLTSHPHQGSAHPQPARWALLPCCSPRLGKDRGVSPWL